MGQGAVRVRLDVNDAQAGVLLRAAGARRFAHNWAVGKVKANADQWRAEASYDIAKPDRVRPADLLRSGEAVDCSQADGGAVVRGPLDVGFPVRHPRRG
jgi:putative transposase